MAKQCILVVDDEEDILELLRYRLEQEGYHVLSASSGEEALFLLDEKSPDLLVLDLMLPGMDGLEITRHIRMKKKNGALPIIMLSARGEEADVVTGLELGADDYVTKPFSPRILLARIRSVLKRRLSEREETSDKDEKPLYFGELSIHPGRHEVRIGHLPVSMTWSEFRILLLLARRPGWVFTRSQIVDALHGEDYAVTERSVDVQIAGIRKKLAFSGGWIETVRGIGYRFRDEKEKNKEPS